MLKINFVSRFNSCCKSTCRVLAWLCSLNLVYVSLKCDAHQVPRTKLRGLIQGYLYIKFVLQRENKYLFSRCKTNLNIGIKSLLQ